MEIDARLLENSIEIKTFKLCQLRLVKDGEVDWFMLIPLQEGIKEWSDLAVIDQYVLTQEIDYICHKLKTHRMPDKMNVASLGNMVPQMHVHIIARYKTDRAWPHAIWGTESPKMFSHNASKFWKEIL